MTFGLALATKAKGLTTPASILALAVLAACSEPAQQETTGESATAQMEASATTTSTSLIETPATSPADEFMAAFSQHCGQAYAGRVLVNEPPAADDPFAGQTLVMHVRECMPGVLHVPFHVGDDHSRTWVLTRTDSGVRLKHDHRHEDGSEDAVTQYGGDTSAPGTAIRQEFPVDQFSIEMFGREGLDVSVTNTWAMEIEPGSRFLYELSRPGGRMFQVEFDLTQPVDLPPTPWGW